jgi:eukaryotic-like serine/threonine-protein kinase
MELTVQNVYGLLLRSKLLSVDEAKGMFARWQQEAKSAANNLARFASWMVANRYLTDYQARLLARGHAEGFFLNEYKILDRLGKGRMAGVYKAQHHLGQIVAIKVLPPSKARDPQLLARFHRESRLALQLKHPNIVRTFQTGNAQGLLFLVMEYLDGETLDEVLARRGKLPPNEAVRLIYQALQGLQHIHTQGLIHRDLKPANLMLVGTNPDSSLRATVKILDIGLGRILFDEGTAEVGGLTGEGVLLGTPDYMSPEQARDPRHADIRSDIYSLGCVLYHTLAGQPPFPDTNIISQMIRHATEAAKPLKAFNPAVPDGLQQILNWMMAKDAAQRYPTPERAAQALQVFLTAGSEQLAAPESDPKMRPFLTWLEVERGKQLVASGAGAAKSKPPSGTQPAASVAPPSLKPPKPPDKNRPDQPANTVRAGRKNKKKRRGGQRLPAGASVSLPEATLLGEIDVELVPFTPTGGAASKPAGWRLNRREVILFAIGAIAGALVTFVAFLLAQLARHS